MSAVAGSLPVTLSLECPLSCGYRVTHIYHEQTSLFYHVSLSAPTRSAAITQSHYFDLTFVRTRRKKKKRNKILIIKRKFLNVYLDQYAVDHV